MKKNKIGLIILLIGLILMLYPLLSDILFSYNHSTAISKYEENVTIKAKDEILKMKEESEKYNQELKDSEKGQVKTPDEVTEKGVSYLNLLNQGDVLGYIKIPKIDVNLPIYHGVSNNILETGIGHMERTSLPTGKTNSHCVLAGHSGLMKSRLFDDIDKLEIGDIFLITVLDETYAYEVDQIKVVEPKETKDIEIVEGKEYVTLLTCVPYGINSHRLLVRGTGIDETTLPKEKLIEEKFAQENPEVKEEIREKTDKKVIFDITTVIEKIRIALIIIFVIAIIIVKLYLNDYDKRIKKRIRKIKENEEVSDTNK